MAQREKVYAERNRGLQEVCQSHPDLYQHPSKGNAFWFDLNDHLAVCMHAKVRYMYVENMQILFINVVYVYLGRLLNMEKKHAFPF